MWDRVNNNPTNRCDQKKRHSQGTHSPLEPEMSGDAVTAAYSVQIPIYLVIFVNGFCLIINNKVIL